MIAEILCIGTELLMGQVLNTNAQFLSRRLSALGITMQHQTVVGDNAQRLEAAYRLALSRADVVITSGGLGPTVDDITKRIAAKVAGQPLVLFPEAEEMIRQRFAQYGKPMTENNLSQAMFTPDTTLLLNPNGTAPGAIVPMGGGKTVIHLPGPPCELEPMFRASVEPWLMARSGKCLISRYIRIFGMGESEVDHRLRDIENGSNPSLSPYCSLGEVQLRLTASADTEAEAEAMLHPVLDEVRTRLGGVIYAIRPDDGGSLAHSAVEALAARRLTVALHEAATGGAIAAAISDIPGASAVFAGGMIAPQYASFDAAAMALQARDAFHADIAVSTVTDGNATVIGIAAASGARTIRLNITGNRERIRTLAMKHALNAIRLEAAP